MYCPHCGTQINPGTNFCPSCGAPASSGNPNQNPNANNPVPVGGYKANIPFRNIAVCILLSIVTCGIYSIIWTIRIVDDLNIAAGKQNETSGAVVWLLGLVTCGIYTLYWLYCSGEKVGELHRRNGMQPGNEGVIYLVLALFGFSIVSYAMIQNELNKVATIV